MSLSSKVLNAVNTAKKSLGDLVVQATVTKVVNTGYNTTTLRPDQTSTNTVVDGFVGSWTEDEIRDHLLRTKIEVRADDVMFYVFPTSIEIAGSDKVLLNGVNYIVLSVSPTVVGSRTVLSTLHLRR